MKPVVVTRKFAGKRLETPELIESVSAETQAGLRQFSLERMMGYGIDYADAIELRARVVDGEPWTDAAQSLAKALIDLTERQSPPATAQSKANYHFRASALLRMSQALMLEDTEARRDIVTRALKHYSLAAEFDGNRQHVMIETEHGPLSGWFFPADGGDPAGSVIAIGGIEGWAMDFERTGWSLAARGVQTLVLDAPGQGETRILHRHYLSRNWLESFRKVIDYVEALTPELPIGIVGNSMGGSVAIAVANNDSRIVACCNNGGVTKPSLGRMAGGTFFAKMVAFCGTMDEEEAVAIWDTALPLERGPNSTYPLLTVQGGRDPLVSVEHGKMLTEQAPAGSKEIEIFSDGDHCIYNHRQDRENFISDWMRAQLINAARNRNTKSRIRNTHGNR